MTATIPVSNFRITESAKQQTMHLSVKYFLPVVFVLLTAAHTAVCQEKEEIYLFQQTIESRIANSTSPAKYQEGAVNYSFACNFPKALSTFELGFFPRPYVATGEDSSIIQRHVVKSAKDYIIERSEKEQLIIINEAHHIPGHRTFTRSLLKDLYKNGYRYLGLEAIFDEEINVRNFATTESGYYTSEPEFGNLIYEARKIGFFIFGYEASPESMKTGKEREIAQAGNIKDFMEQHTDGKTLIHCGYEHAYESEHPGWEKAMAGRIRELTGIDPLTVDQAKFSERSSVELNHFFSKTESKFPYILVNEKNEPFNHYRGRCHTDLIVVHPITTYKDQRPEWFTTGKIRHEVSNEQYKTPDTPVQVLAYRTGEFEKNGIPADVVEFSSGNPVSLYLETGTYLIVIKDSNYQTLTSYPLTIN